MLTVPNFGLTGQMTKSLQPKTQQIFLMLKSYNRKIAERNFQRCVGIRFCCAMCRPTFFFIHFYFLLLPHYFGFFFFREYHYIF